MDIKVLKTSHVNPFNISSFFNVVPGNLLFVN